MFNEQDYLNGMQKVYELHTDIEKIADSVYEEGIENIFFIAIGGSQAVISGIAETLKTKTNIPIFVQSASEIPIAPHKLLTKKTLVVTMSKSGDTKETLAAIESIKKSGIRIFSLICVEDSPLAKLSTYYVVNPIVKGAESMYLLLFFFTLRILYKNGEYDQYTDFVSQMKELSQNFVRAKNDFNSCADIFVSKYKDIQNQLWIGSGNCAYEVYNFAMCILEEMQWIRTKSITSAEFFHGTLEIVEENTCVVLVKGLDNLRVLDNRVEDFVKTITNQLTIIDLKKYTYPNIKEEYYSLMAPALMSCLCTERLASKLSVARDHPLDLRRYYRQMEY